MDIMKMLLFFLGSLMLCHTIGGVGNDVEAVGSDINSAARSTSRSM